MRFASMHFTVVALVTTALLACGDDVSGPETNLLHLQGTVVDAATEVPIEGAQIILQWSAGAFGTGTEWAETDAEGQYDLQGDFGGASFGCDGFGMTAQAEGYQPEFVQPGEIQCVREVQTFDFALDPEAPWAAA